MIEVLEMGNDDIQALLESVGYGHLACVRGDEPYVVPIHYAYSRPEIYIYTTEGKKTDIIGTNPKVCLQVEDVKDSADWRSVVVSGTAEQVTDHSEREKILELILKTNPTLTPAISIRWMDNWVRANHEVVYRIIPDVISGRFASPIEGRAAQARPKRDSPADR